ncbi:MAG: hypothetical protein ABL921_30005 [Pirellula sp.]
MNPNQILSADEYSHFLRSLHNYGKRSIRIRLDRLDTPLPFDVHPIPWFANGRFLDDSGVRPAAFMNYAVADYYIQDAASMLALALMDIKPDEWVCDLCAAPGGKASAIAEQLGKDGFLLANESIRSRLEVLKYALARTGQPTYATCCYDPEELADAAAQCFDAVLVDAPCSGQTLVGKNKRDSNAFALHQIEHCALRQRRILLSAVRLLKPGGRLVYSTCTFSSEENEEQLRWLHTEFPNCWEPIVPETLQNWQSSIESGCYRLWPHRDECAGGFAAAVRMIREIDVEKIQAQGSSGISNSLNQKKRSKSAPRPPDATKPIKNRPERTVERKPGAREFLAHIGDVHQLEMAVDQRGIFGGTAGTNRTIESLRPLVLDAPTWVIANANHFVPTQALAMLTPEYFDPHCKEVLDDASAIAFMAGISVQKTSTIARTGNDWSIAHWRNKPLGWLKFAGNRWNNHLPAWARLRID